MHLFLKEILNLKLLMEYLIFQISYLQEHPAKISVKIFIKFDTFLEIVFDTDGIDMNKLSNKEYHYSLG